MKRGKLTAKQAQFVQEYLVDFNATQAAIRAGYSARTADRIGPELLGKTWVGEAIRAAREKLAARTNWTQERVVAVLASIAESDIGDILDFSGPRPRLKAANDIPVHARRTISSMKVRHYVERGGEEPQEVEIIEFKLWDKQTATDQIARLFGFYKPTKVAPTDPSGENEFKGGVLVVPTVTMEEWGGAARDQQADLHRQAAA